MNYFKDLFESITDYKKIVLLMFLIKNDEIILERGYQKNGINRLCLEFRNILLEQTEDT